MTAGGQARSVVERAEDRTLVWIDARQAVIGHWHAGEVRLERLHSDVPPRHRAMGHVRRDPTVRHGGGAAQDAAEANRLEHLARFIDLVATHIPPDGDIQIIGPGTVRDRLGHRLREGERRGSEGRAITIDSTGRLTEPQLAARLRHFAGADEPRRTIGTHRRTDRPARGTSGGPRPVTPPPIEFDDA